MAHRPSSPALKRVPAGAIVLALVGVSVFGGALSAAAAPTNFTFAPIGYTVTTGSTQYVEGTVAIDAESAIQVVVTASESGATCSDTIPAGAPPTGWGCTITLTPGANTLTAVASFVDGDPTDTATRGPQSLTRYGISLTAPAASPAVTTSQTPTIQGTTAPNALVEVSDLTSGGSPICNVAAQPDGSWSCVSNRVLSEGTHDLLAYATANAGSADTSRQILIDVPDAPGAPVIDSEMPTEIDAGDSLTISGTGTSGATASVAVDGVERCTPAVLEDGTWSCSFTPFPFAPGTHTISVTQTLGGLTSPADTASVQVNGALITSPTSGQVVDSTVVVSGSVTGGATSIFITTDGEGWEEVPVESGTWSTTVQNLPASESLTFSVSLADGGHIDDAVDVQVIPAPELAGPYTATSHPVVITGTGEPSGEGAQFTIEITVFAEGGEGDSATCTTTTTEDGSFSCTLGTVLDNGDYTVSATQVPSWTDEQSASATAALTVDAPLPGRDSINCTFVPGGVIVTSGVPNTRVQMWGVQSGDNYSPSNLGLCSGRAGTPAPDAFDDTPYVGDCTAEGSGTDSEGEGGEGSGDITGNLTTGCAITGLGPGTWNLYYGPSGTKWDWFFTIPDASAVTLAAPATTPGSARFAGTGTPGNTVTVENLSGVVVCSAVAVDSAGNWSCTASVPNTSTRYRAYETDAGSGAKSPYSAAAPASGPLTIGALTLPQPGLFGATTKTVVQGDSFTMSGSKSPGATVNVTILRNGQPVGSYTPCSQTAGGDPATWDCTYSTAGLVPGTYSLSITQTVNGQTSAELIPRPLLVVTEPLAAASPTPEPTRTPLSWSFTMSGVNGPLKPGDTVVISSSGLPEGTLIEAELHSTPRALGSTTVGADGTFELTVTIPLDVEAGEHHIVVTATPPGEMPSPVEEPVTVELDTKAVGDTVDRNDPRVLLAGAAGGQDPRNEPGAPTAITRAVPTFLEILGSPATIGIAGGLALVILLLVALPAEILNSTIESNSNRFGRVFGAIQAAVDRGTAWFIRVTRTPVIASAILLLLTAIIFGFIDPAFGFDLASVRLVLSLALGLFVVTFVASRLTGVVIGRRFSLESEIGMQPAALLFAILGVVVARLLDFSPGFLIGLVLGLELAHRATGSQRVRALVIEFSFIVGFGVVAWLVYSAWVGLQGDGELDFVGGLLQDALVAVTSEGLTAVMVAMIPIAFLDGKKIFDESKKLWAVMFLVVGTAFSLLVLPTALAGQEIGNVVTWVIVLVAFAVVTFGVTLWLRVTGRSAPAVVSQKVDA